MLNKNWIKNQMNLNYIINKLIDEIDLNIKCEENGIDFYVLETLDKEFLIRIITPHKGNNFNFIIRAEYSNYFDKWGNATYEEYLKNECDLSSIIKDLKNMIKYKDQILIKKYDGYNEEYYYEINEEEYERILLNLEE